MIKIDTKKTAYIEDYYGYGDKFFTLKNNEEIGDKLILLKGTDFNVNKMFCEQIERTITDTEDHEAVLAISEGLVGVCILYTAYSDDLSANFYELKDYSSLISDEEIKSIIDKAIKDRIHELKEELSVLEPVEEA